MKQPSFPSLALLLAALLTAGAAASGSAEGPPPGGIQATAVPDLSYLALFEGLHITGTPIDIDLADYRLKVGGLVDNRLSLSFQELSGLPAVEKSATLECPGFFIDAGKWTGVPVAIVLEKAGIKPGASEVEFSTPDDSYSTKLSLDKVMDPGTMLAWSFDGKPFHRVHGFPLRLVVPDMPGGMWVKWLGKIEVK